MKLAAILLAVALMVSIVSAINVPDVSVSNTGGGLDVDTNGADVYVGADGGVTVDSSAEPVLLDAGDDRLEVTADGETVTLDASDDSIQVEDNGEKVAVKGTKGKNSVMVQNRAVEVVSADGVVSLNVGNAKAQSNLEVKTQDDSNGTKLEVQLSNGRNAEVKIMPDTASDRAIERLSIKVCSDENGCTIELKETGQGDEVKLTYEVKATKQSRLFGIFKKDMNVEVQVDAESGVVINSHKPWWAFLATE